MKVLGNNLFNDQPEFKAILAALQENRKPEVTGLSGVSKALFMRALGCQLNRPLLIVGEEEPSLKFYEDLLLFAGAAELDIFLDEEYGYLRLMEAIRNKTNYFCVASREALAQTVIPFAQYQKLYFSLSAGQTIQLEKLAGALVAAGYQRTSFVEKPGEFSVRGGIVDVFVPLAEHPVRLEFNGNMLESLRQFESFTQRSVKSLEKISLLPLKTGQGQSPLWSYFSDQTIVVKNELLAPQEPLPLGGSWTELSLTLSKSPQTISFDFQPMESFHSSIDRLKERLKQWRAQGYAVTLVADNAGQQQRLQELLSRDADFCRLMSGVISGGFISTALKVAEKVTGSVLERKSNGVSP